MNLLIFLNIFFSSLTAHAASRQVTLITMEIPPYMSSSMPDQGAAIYALRKSFKKAGYKLNVNFVPVLRIRAVGLADENINGFFPSFQDEIFHGQKLTLSKLFYQTPWVIVERKDNPIQWKTGKDLLKYKGGNVAGYIIRSQVADAYKNNQNRLETATNDTINILKLIMKRIDFIFIDQNAFRYISKTNPEIKPYAQMLSINPRVVAHNRYGVGFKPGSRNNKIMAEFNKVADEDEYTAWVNKYIDEQIAKAQP